MLKQGIYPFRTAKKILGPLFAVMIITCHAWAEPPKMVESMVYKLRLFNGKGYTDSFCPEDEAAIYIMANADNILLPKMTLVYFWAPTRKLQAGFNTLNEAVEGKLEIVKDDKVVARLTIRSYALYFAEGWYSDRSQAILDDIALKKYEEYTKTRNTFRKLEKEYVKKQRQYQRQLKDFYAKIKKRDTSKQTSDHSEKIPIPKEPIAPAPLGYFMQKPQEGYILNLPAGDYAIRLRAEDGSIVEGSEKKIVSFTHRRKGKVGYEIIPSNRWTMPEISSTDNDVIYMVGKHTLYFKPYVQNEYNHHYYSKLLDPQNEGYPERWIWVNIKQVKSGTLQLIGKNQIVSNIQEKPYFVKQIAGAELGYTIENYDKKKLSDQKPSFTGYKVDYNSNLGNSRIQLADATGQILPESIRKLRMVKPGRTRVIYILSVILPLLIAIPVLLRRKRQLRKL